MVSWGLGHNLEKNLQKAHALREKGEDRRALEALLGWAERHEDTPHYLYEAALTAFDLGDPASGLNSLKTLLRRFPDTREKVLAACGDQFRQRPNLPLAEFLIDDHTAARRFKDALEVIDRVSPDEAQTYAKRVAMRHQSLSATPNTPEAKVLQIQASRLVAAHAAADSTVYLEAMRALLEADAALAEDLLELSEAESSEAEILLARGCCHHASGDLPRACRLWVEALGRQPGLADTLRELLERVQPQKKERGLWLAAQAHVALVDADAERASDLFGQACEADASLREEVLETLARLDPESPLRADASLAKLQLRLYVVLHRAEDAAQFSRDLRERGVVELADIRRLMHGSGDDEDDIALQTALAEAAIFDHDLAAAAEQAHAISDQQTAALRRLLDAIDAARENWPVETRISLDSFGAVLAARAKEPDRCNQLLESIWQGESPDIAAASSVTHRCLEMVAAQRGSLAAALRTLLDRQATDPVRELLELVFAKGQGSESSSPSDATDGGFQSVQFEDAGNALDLDLGGLDQDLDEELVEVPLMVVREDSSRSACLLSALDACVPAMDTAKRFRHTVAYAALFAGQIDRALGELAVLQVTGGPEMSDLAREYLEKAVEQHEDSASLRAALAEMRGEAGDLLGAAQQLAEALRRNPNASDDLSQRFDRLLARDLGPAAGSIWLSYAEALFDTGRFAHLRSVCERGREHCDESASARLDLLATRVMVEEGQLSDALRSVQQLLRRPDGDAQRMISILDVILEAHPGSAPAHFLRGEACHRAGLAEEALTAWTHAVRCDESLAVRVEEKIQRLQAHPSVGGPELFRMAKYHVGRENWRAAAELLTQAIRVDESVAARVLGEFEEHAVDRDADLDLMLAVAAAARVAGRPETACELLGRVDRRDDSRIEVVLTGFRQVRESARHDLEAVAAMSRVLMRHRMTEAAGRSVADAGADDDYPIEERQALLTEFHRRCPEDTDVALALARLYSRRGQVDEASAILEEPTTLHRVDVDAAVETVRELREAEPGLARLALLEHDLLLRSGSVEESLAALPLAETVDGVLLDELASRFDGHREIALRGEASAENYGRVLWKQGRHADALAALREAVQALRPSPVASLRWCLAELLVQSDLAEEAAQVLDLRHADPEQRRQAYEQLAETRMRRLDAEIEALRAQWKRHPDAAHVSLRLARRLASRGSAREAEELLCELEVEGDARVRRALLLAEIRLELGRADRAESILRSILSEELSAKARQRAGFLMAQCATLLARPAEARARLTLLQDQGDVTAAISAATRRAYDEDLADVAGDFRAVLMGVGDLDAELHPLQERS